MSELYEDPLGRRVSQPAHARRDGVVPAVAGGTGNAERSGLEISDRMREVFGAMPGTAEDGDLDFRYAMGRLLDYRPEAGYGATSSPGQGAFWRVVSEKTF